MLFLASVKFYSLNSRGRLRGLWVRGHASLAVGACLRGLPMILAASLYIGGGQALPTAGASLAAVLACVPAPMILAGPLSLHRRRGRLTHGAGMPHSRLV